jgi:hypothetical protein
LFRADVLHRADELIERGTIYLLQKYVRPWYTIRRRKLEFRSSA